MSIFQFVQEQQQSEPNQNVSYAASQQSTFISSKRTQISEKNKDLQDELVSLQKTLELLETPVQEPVRLGKGVQICGHCHHRGHRNDARHACEYVKCIGFRHCGHQKLHPEHAQEISDAKRNIKRLENEIRKGDETLKTITNFESKSETYFFSEMLPRLKAVDTMRYQNKALLFKDLRILKSAFDSKVPEAKPNDKTFLRSTLESERNKIAQTSREYVLGCDDNISEVNKTSPINTQCRKRALSYETSSETMHDSERSSSSSDWSSSDSMNENYDRYDKQKYSHRRRQKRTRKRKHHKQASHNVRLVSYDARQSNVITVSPSQEKAGRRLDPINHLENTPRGVNLHVNQATNGSKQYYQGETRLDIDTLLYAANLQGEHCK